MSRSVDLFIQSSLAPAELAEAVGRLVERQLLPGAVPDTWVLKDGETEALLRAHPYVDDADLPFSSYRYALSAAVPNDVRLQEAPATELLRRVADRLQRGGGIAVLLVLDLQYRDRATASVPGQPAGAADARSGVEAAPEVQPALDGAAE